MQQQLQPATQCQQTVQLQLVKTYTSAPRLSISGVASAPPPTHTHTRTPPRPHLDLLAICYQPAQCVAQEATAHTSRTAHVQMVRRSASALTCRRWSQSSQCRARRCPCAVHAVRACGGLIQRVQNGAQLFHESLEVQYRPRSACCTLHGICCTWYGACCTVACCMLHVACCAEWRAVLRRVEARGRRAARGRRCVPGQPGSTQTTPTYSRVPSVAFSTCGTALARQIVWNDGTPGRWVLGGYLG
jgi:hypothetical protein